MKGRSQGRSAIDIRVDYVESKLDESINSFKEAIRDNKEAIRENKEALQQFINSFDKFINKVESSRRWSIGMVITIAIALIGFIITNGIQIQF